MFEEIEKEFASSPNVFFSRFDRLNVQDMGELRRILEKVSRRTLVVKHSLTKKILEKTQFSEAIRFLEGSVLVTLGVEDPQQASKTLVGFSKGHESLRLVGMVLEGKVYGADLIKELARLPSRQGLLAAVVGRMQSPIARFVFTLTAVLQSLVIALSEIQKKRAQGETAS